MDLLHFAISILIFSVVDTKWFSNSNSKMKDTTTTATTKKQNANRPTTPVPTLVPINRKTTPTPFLQGSEKHPCDRNCSCDPDTYMTCNYFFRIHYNETATADCGDCPTNPDDCENDYCNYADGRVTKFIPVNNKLPGPAIKVCQGDFIIVEVKNELLEPTTIHWHGIFQEDTSYMDGVPYVTQYPLQPGLLEQYRFSATHSGTYFYHSHMDMQRAHGHSGPLIVRKCDVVPECEEVIIMVQDWGYDFDWRFKANLFVNGRGRLQTDNSTNPNLFTQFKFQTAKCYDLHIIYNGYSNCPIEFSIDGHSMVITESDGSCLEPLEVESLEICSGERYVARIYAHQAMGWYWMRFRGLLKCNLFQGAIIKYGEEGTLEPLNNSYQLLGSQYNSLSIERIEGVQTDDIPIYVVPSCNEFDYVCDADQTLYFTLDSRVLVNDSTIKFGINNIYSQHLSNFSLLNMKSLIDESELFCNKEKGELLGWDCFTDFCQCPHMITLPTLKCIEMVFTNTNEEAHPLHLHGYTFWVVQQGILTEDELQMFEEVDKQVPYPRKIDRAPLKDTVMVPPSGYLIIRFFTDNPGFWLFHCHVETHAANGMSMILKVGEDEEIPDPPSYQFCNKEQSFRRCRQGSSRGRERNITRFRTKGSNQRNENSLNIDTKYFKLTVS